MMMMQLNHVICSALMISILLPSAFALFSGSESVKGWTGVFNLFDTDRDGSITEEDMNKFFRDSEFAENFDDSARANIYKLIRDNGGAVNLDKFLSVATSWKITTLKALQNAFPGQTSVSGQDLNKELKLGSNDFHFDPDTSYNLQVAADMIDQFMSNNTE